MLLPQIAAQRRHFYLLVSVLYQTLPNSFLHCNGTQLRGQMLGTASRMLTLFYCMNAIKAQQLSHDFTHNVTD